MVEGFWDYSHAKSTNLSSSLTTDVSQGLLQVPTAVERGQAGKLRLVATTSGALSSGWQLEVEPLSLSPLSC